MLVYRLLLYTMLVLYCITPHFYSRNCQIFVHQPLKQLSLSQFSWCEPAYWWMWEVLMPCWGKKHIHGLVQERYNWFIDSDDGLSPVYHQTYVGLLYIGHLWTYFSYISIKILIFHFKKCIWKCCLQNGSHLVPCQMWCEHSCRTANALFNHAALSRTFRHQFERSQHGI